MKKPFIWLLVGLSLAFLLVSSAIDLVRSLSHNPSDVVFKNNSAETISLLQVEVCHQKFSTKDMLAGDHVKFDFNAYGESDYKIDAKFELGKNCKTQLYYVTSGIPFHDIFSVESDHIDGCRNEIKVECGK